jgi:hypothetical protein
MRALGGGGWGGLVRNKVEMGREGEGSLFGVCMAVAWRWR